MKINKYKIIVLTLINFFVFSGHIFADWIDVTSNLPSGTYDKVIKIILTPTDNKAKTFYSFNPNWWPNDALLYTWPIILKKSTPLVFFSFINTEIESKIKINNYILNYSNNINLFWDATFSNWKISNLFIKNNDQKDIDISFWELRSSWKIYTIPDRTTLYPGQTLDVSNAFSLSWTITLFSPNSESKDFVNVVEIPKVVEEPKPEPAQIKKETPNKTEIKNETQKIETQQNTEIPAWEPKNNEVAPVISPTIIENTTPKNPEINVDNIAKEITNVEEKPTENLWDNLKISVNWTKNDANWIFILISIIIVTLAWVWIQVVIRRKKV